MEFDGMSFVDTINNVNRIYIAATKNHKTIGLGELNGTFFYPLSIEVCPFRDIFLDKQFEKFGRTREEEE